MTDRGITVVVCNLKHFLLQ